jgi:hypothetical protein
MIVAATAPASPGMSPAPAVTPAPSASPSPGVSPAPAASADPNLVKARAEFEAWQSGKIDLSHYIPEAVKQFTDAVVKQISKQSLRPLGAIKTFTQIRVVTTPVAQIFVYHAMCANGAMDEAISWDAAGKIQYIQFVQPQR